MTEYDPNYVHVKNLVEVGQKAVVYNDKGEVLLLRRSEKMTRPGGWDFPGGGLEKEDPTEGMIREIQEETGLTVTDVKPIHVRADMGDNDSYIMVGYSAKAVSTEITLSWEHDMFEWVSRDEALKRNLPDFLQSFLEKFTI